MRARKMARNHNFPLTVLFLNNNLGLLGISLRDVGTGAHDDIFA